MDWIRGAIMGWDALFEMIQLEAQPEKNQLILAATTMGLFNKLVNFVFF